VDTSQGGQRERGGWREEIRGALRSFVLPPQKVEPVLPRALCFTCGCNPTALEEGQSNREGDREGEGDGEKKRREELSRDIQ